LRRKSTILRDWRSSLKKGNTMKLTRKSFLRLLGAAGLAAGAATVNAFPRRSAPAGNIKEAGLKLGLASYSLRKFDLDQAIDMTRKVGLKHIALKSMHMPLDSQPAEIEAIAARIRSAGIDLYGAGVIYMRSEKEVRQAFQYARQAGLRVIIGVPNRDLLPLVDQKVKETDITVAIHNHGPGDDLYPSPGSIYEKVKGLDRRIGLCMDIGHTRRIGLDPAAEAEKYAERLYDLHLKDVDKPTAEGTNIEIGRGIIDIPKFLQTLKKINYQGILSFEYEKDEDDPLAGLAESVGYVRGVMAAM
jgi:inosose dehydratase